jgi:hypothetical protein
MRRSTVLSLSIQLVFPGKVNGDKDSKSLKSGSFWRQKRVLNSIPGMEGCRERNGNDSCAGDQ